MLKAVRGKPFSMNGTFPNGSESSVVSISDQLHRPVVVAMIAMCVMEPSVDEVIEMITVRDGFVSAVRTVLVAWAPDFGGAVHGVRGADRDDMLVNMIPVHVVQMAVMKIVNMAVMANSRMPAVRAMLVDMVGMLPLGAGGHEILLLLRLRSRCLCLSAGPLVWALAGLCALILWWQLIFPMVVAPVSMRRIDRRADSISAAMYQIADPMRYG
jgi:hypothetical protein